MKVITYRITLLEPVLASSLDGDPNSATSFDYLPGSVLRGAFIGQFFRTRQIPLAQFNAADPELRRLFFEGTTRYLNGYRVEDNQRTLPVPQSWRRKKGAEDELSDFAVESREGEEDENGHPIQWEGVSKPFCLLIDTDTGAAVQPIQPDRIISVHTARDRRYGRARTDSGAIYRYETLQAGQTFEAAVLCDSDPDATLILPLIDGQATLGGSRSGGYGRVRFEQVPQQPDWREVGGTLQAVANGRLTITLLSDAIVRNLNGQSIVDSPTVTAAFASSMGGVPLKPDETRTFLRGTTVGGFNRKWGLPLQQTLAVKMGSVFVYEPPAGDANVLRDALRILEHCGIGERRAEGFGRVAVNWQTEEVLKTNDSKSGPPAAKTIADGSSLVVAQGIANRMLRRRLDAFLTQKANALGKHMTGPKNSQLSRLRLIIHDALRQGPALGRPRLDQYFNSLYDRQTTRKQFTRDRVAGKGLLEWLRERVADETTIWEAIGFSQTELPKVGANVTATLTAELVYEFNLRLIDGVLARAAKNAKGEK